MDCTGEDSTFTNRQMGLKDKQLHQARKYTDDQPNLDEKKKTTSNYRRVTKLLCIP